MEKIPDCFISWAYKQRAELVRRQAREEKISPNEIFLGFTRHTPTVITDGPAGLNGSIKGVGFIPRPEFMEEIIEEYMKHINGPMDKSYSQRGLEILDRLVWADGKEEIFDFSLLGTLELAKKHTWRNLHFNNRATLLFYQPPAISFEVRCVAQIEESGPVQKYLNAQHDIYHGPNVNSWDKRPAYVFHIEEIFDNSAGRKGFGTRVFPEKEV